MTDIKTMTSEDEAALQAGDLLTQKALLERGWTKKEIEDLLPEPELYANPVYASGAPMKVWERDAVESIEDAEQVGRRKL